MGFATKNNSAISLGLSEASQSTMGRDDSSQLSVQNKNNRLLGVQGRYAPCGIDIDKGKICSECGLIWTLEKIIFEIRRQSFPNQVSDTREFYICTNMYHFNRMRDKLGIMYS